MAATVGEEAGATTAGVSVCLVGSSGTVSIVTSAVVDIVGRQKKKMLTTQKDVRIARRIESSGASDDDKNYDIRRHNRWHIVTNKNWLKMTTEITK